MKVKDVMSTPPVTCRTSSSVAEAAAEMWRHDCGALPVVDEHDTAVGMITDRDICIAVGTRDRRAADIPVQSVITGHLTYVHPDDQLSTALDAMQRERVHRLAVLDEQAHVVGVVSINDLVLRAGDQARDESLSTNHVLSTVRQISTHWLPVPTEHIAAVASAPIESVQMESGPARRPTRARRNR